jgi:threonylcarbamoyladenosine tRNA methylthiotransferase MtaB
MGEPSPTSERRPLRVALTTLGCKLNQYDTEGLRERLEDAGMTTVGFEEPADVFIINSCTVTSRSDRDCRRLVRQARRRNPAAKIVVTGCYAQRRPQDLLALPEVDLVVGLQGRARLAGLLTGESQPEGRCLVSDISGLRRFCDLSPRRFASHTRAFLKVQDGCDEHCAYCAVRSARGPARSRPLEEVLHEAGRLLDAGHRELVLVGVTLGAYGRDLGDVTLGRAVRELCRLPLLGRVRLSSIEPWHFGDDLIQALVESPQVCRHLHVPLQSADDEVLARMGRPYTAADYAALLKRLGPLPHLGLGTDILAGFPGETEQAFERTYRFVQEQPFTYLHVFSYTPRPDTPAAAMSGQVQEEIKKMRSRRLIELGKRKAAAFRQSLVGTLQEVLVEAGSTGAPAEGLTGNYVRVHISEGRPRPGDLVRLEITAAAEGHLLGRALE